MKRTIAAFTIALASAAVLVAQDAKIETTVKIDGDAKPVMFTGCLQAGTVSDTFVLESAVPVKQETTAQADVNAAGQPHVTQTTTTTYALVPSGTVEFQQNIGHKVEVTGILVEAGEDAEIKSESNVEVEGQPDRRVESVKEIEAPDDRPRLQVVSIKHLDDRCTATP
jgi:hypothetical protein